MTPTITPKAVSPLLNGVEIIYLNANFIESKILKFTPELPFHLSFL